MNSITKTISLILLSAALPLSVFAQQKPPEKPIVTYNNPVKVPVNLGGKVYMLPDNLKIIKDEKGLYKLLTPDHKVGNGGDYLRTQFLAVGSQVMKYIENSDAVRSDNLNMDDVRSTLSIERVAVVDDLLIDNSGSVVDAIGVPGLVLINADAWKEHFEKQRNVYYLVFHEMLRSASVNDDNYVISKKIMEFPVALQLNTQLVPQKELVAEDSLAGIISRARIQTGGNGCPNSSNRFFTDLNLSNNSYELSLYDYVTSVNPQKLLDRKTCNLIIPVTLPAKKRLVISLIDLQGSVSGQNPASLTTGKISFEAFIATGSNKPQTRSIVLNQGDKSFIMRKTNALTSACGGESQLRLNTNVILQAPPAQIKPQQVQNPPPPQSEIMQVKKLSIYMSLEDCQ